MANLKKAKSKNFILVTGCGGFIGFHLALYLLKKNFSVIGIDNLNNYYSKKLKIDRVKELKKFASKKNKKFSFFKFDLSNNKKLQKVFKKKQINKVVHLAAQAGVRYSLIQPEKYFTNNLLSFFNILEACKDNKIKKLIFASSSSVYGNSKKFKFSEKDSTDYPIQFYAATKKSNEVMAHAYSSLYKLKCFGLRFFTVYGPWGRPDMSIFMFTKNILENKKIKVFNKGKHSRDFTYVDDICESIYRLLNIKGNKIKENFKIFNIGSSNPYKLKYLIQSIEKLLEKKAKKEFLGLQKGDVEKTFANTELLYKTIKYKPKTKLKDGLKSFVNWYKNYYKK